MLPLHRHQLAHPGSAGWAAIRSRPWDAEARSCIDHWAAHRLPLVVTRQQPTADGRASDSIALGLPAPAAWGRRRLMLELPYRSLACFDEFAPADAALRLLPRECRSGWRKLCQTLAGCGARARIYGSFGWQLATGLAYLREGSDIDLWIAVENAPQADAVAAVLASFAAGQQPRIDGELVFGDGAAVAWREWKAWRAGRTRQLLVKRIDGASLTDASFAERYLLLQELAA